MIDEAEPQAYHDIVLRGAGKELWRHYLRAIYEGVEPPLEWIAEGRAGTGKSMGWLGATISLASLYPKVPGRVLITRLTRRSLTTSTCVTLRKLLYAGHPMLEGPRDDHRTSYFYGNWEFVLAGLDNAENLLSTEWDIVGAEECRQIPMSIWEEFSRGVRNYALYRYDESGNLAAHGQGVSPIPWGMVVGATNPWTPKFWIKRRAAAGQLDLVHTTINENPAYYDDQGQITAMGIAYERRMGQTTGIRYRRLVRGEWCAAEGAVFEEWNGDPDDIGKPESNLVRIPRDKDGWITRETLKALDIREFYAGVDFGDDAAGVLVLAGLTGAGKLIVIGEVYARRKDLDWWEAKVRLLHAHYPITLGFCDHNRPDWTRAFNDVVGAPREGPGQVFVNADKGRDRGLQIMRLRIARKTLVYDVDALVHAPDESLIEAGLPTCTADEMPELIFDRAEDDDDVVSAIKPADRIDPDAHDHGYDASRYLAVGIEYFEPEEKLAEPLNIAYRDRLRHLHRQTHGVMPEEDDDIEEYAKDEEDDATVDTLMRWRMGL